MTFTRSALLRRAVALAAILLALFAVVVPSLRAAPPSNPPTPSPSGPQPVSAQLVADSLAVPVGGTFGYTAVIRLRQRASYMQTVFQVFRPSGQLLFKRTRVASGVGKGVKRLSFSRGLTDVLALDPGTYPVQLTVTANVGGSTITTETTETLRVYAANGPDVRLALVARVTGQPMSGPDGRFALDPAQATGARDAVAAISRRIITDPRAHVTLAVPPVLLAEWRRLSGGYTLESGASVRPTDTVPQEYNSVLSDLEAAVRTGRLELLSAGYSDPNLSDLVIRKLGRDVGPQYDAGISAVFAALELTPSVGTAPAGECVPPAAVDVLGTKGVRYVVVDSDCVRAGKERPASGAYPIAKEKMSALVAEVGASAALTSGDPSIALDRAFTRLSRASKQPLVMRIDIDGDSIIATESVGIALTAFEAQPWLQLVNARELKPSSSASRVRLLAGKGTPKPPKGYWTSIARSREYARAYYAAFGASNPEATTAEAQALVAEGSAWSGARGSWSLAPRGLEFAKVSLNTTKAVLDRISVNAESITLPGSRGEIPITIDNNTDKTLNVVVAVTSSGGLNVEGSRTIPTTLRPQETYLQIPVDMQTSFSGKLVIEVSAGELTLSRKTVTVSTSYLDRLALGGAAVTLLLGLLVFIVRRARTAESSDRTMARRERYTDDDSDIRSSER